VSHALAGADEQPVPPVDQAALDQLLNQHVAGDQQAFSSRVAEEEKLPDGMGGRQQLGLNQIQEMLEEDISEPTEFQQVGHSIPPGDNMP